MNTKIFLAALIIITPSINSMTSDDEFEKPKKPCRRSSILFSNDDYQTFKATKLLSGIILSELNTINKEDNQVSIFTVNHKNHTSSAKQQQTFYASANSMLKQGLVLENHRTLPSNIITPWGNYSILPDNTFWTNSSQTPLHTLIPQLLKDKGIDMTCRKSEKDVEGLNYNQYDVYKVGVITLPRTEYKINNENINNLEKNAAIWQAMERYEQESKLKNR